MSLSAENIASWKYRRVTKKMLSFYKDFTRLDDGITAVSTKNPDTENFCDGSITVKVANKSGWVLPTLDILARKYGGLPSDDLMRLEGHCFRKYGFSTKITLLDKIQFSLIKNPLTGKVVAAGYSLFR